MVSFVKALKPRSAIARAAYYGGLWRVHNSGAWIVAYHGVVERSQDPWLETDLLPLSVFREHLNYFQKRRSVVSLDELLAYIAGGTAPDPRLVVLCFDDALASLQEYVIPELSARRMPFVIGVPAGLPSTGRSLWEYEAAFLVYLCGAREALPNLMRALPARSQKLLEPRADSISQVASVLANLKGFLRLGVSSRERISILDALIAEVAPDFCERLQADGRFSVMQWEQLREVCSVGGALAAHGYLHHPHNGTLTESSRMEELRRPLELIKQHTGTTTECFIWPEGVVDEASIEMGRGMSYKYFLSSRPGRITCETSPGDVPRVSGQWPLAQVLWNAATLK